MVIPGGVSYDSDYRSVLIEDEYFGLPSAQLVDFIIGKTITGQSSGVKATVVNALTADQSEKGFTTLYVKYLNASSGNSSSVFEDDEILISNESFSIGGTVISENTDFANVSLIMQLLLDLLLQLIVGFTTLKDFSLQ